jgi:hypothetical protein
MDITHDESDQQSQEKSKYDKWRENFEELLKGRFPFDETMSKLEMLRVRVMTLEAMLKDLQNLTEEQGAQHRRMMHERKTLQQDLKVLQGLVELWQRELHEQDQRHQRELHEQDQRHQRELDKIKIQMQFHERLVLILVSVFSVSLISVGVMKL